MSLKGAGETFGERLKRARKLANLNQTELAARIDSTYSTVSDWENDKSAPAMESLGAMSLVLGVSVDWLVNGPNLDALRSTQTKPKGVVQKTEAASDVALTYLTHPRVMA